MAASYWNRLIDQRLSRRRALAATGAVALGAVILAACGSDKEPGPKGNKSSLVAAVVDETKSIKRGGVLKRIVSAEWQPFDPMLSVAIPLGRIYSRLFKVKGGHLEPTTGSVEGDLAESWELSPDKLQLTVKMSNKAKFHPFPPVSGRAPNSQDVVFSYNRLKEIGLSRAALANEVNGSGPSFRSRLPTTTRLFSSLSSRFPPSSTSSAPWPLYQRRPKTSPSWTCATPCSAAGPGWSVPATISLR